MALLCLKQVKEKQRQIKLKNMDAVTSALIKEVVQSPEFSDAVAARVSFIMDGQNAQQKSNPKYYTRRELRDLIRLSYPTIDKYTDDGILKGQRIGNRILYSRESVDEALQNVSRLKYKRA